MTCLDDILELHKDQIYWDSVVFKKGIEKGLKCTFSSPAEAGPVRGGCSRRVLPGAGLVKHRQQLRGVAAAGLEVDHGVRPVAVVAVEDQIPVEVAGVEAGQGKAIAVTRQGGFGR